MLSTILTLSENVDIPDTVKLPVAVTSVAVITPTTSTPDGLILNLWIPPELWRIEPVAVGANLYVVSPPPASYITDP